MPAVVKKQNNKAAASGKSPKQRVGSEAKKAKTKNLKEEKKALKAQAKKAISEKVSISWDKCDLKLTIKQINSSIPVDSTASYQKTKE